ncbi:50S ribosomal protein L28, chloroplastic [Glycine max]|nr:50S ribosomal protein L28, chloroplastic [Glycine max]ACU21357.1 unknown [Glycine max]|eukprot:NP_001241464.1 uncharacterized protein LOC100804320 [Glycine max]
MATASASCAVSFRNSFGVSKPSDLGFLSSRLNGLRICFPKLPPTPLTASPFPTPLPIVAKRVCPFTGKKSNRANKVSFSNHKTKKLQFVNLQYKRIWWEAGKRYVKLRLSTKALKTIEKNGLDAVAKKAGIDLRKK